VATYLVASRVDLSSIELASYLHVAKHVAKQLLETLFIITEHAKTNHTESLVYFSLY
jgi:hypothetical protein